MKALRYASLLAASLLFSVHAQAQVFRAYLASYGNDANPCTVGAPCRLLPAAINAVKDGGEIWMLDSANFNSGTVAVTKSVKIQAIPGQVGSIVPVASTPAMTLSPGVIVTLRNVAIVTNANNPGTDGVQMTTGSLSVEDSVFEVTNGVNAKAIYLGGAGLLSVRNTVFRGNCGYGVFVEGGGQADVSSSTFVNCNNAAVFVDASIASTVSIANVSDSHFTGGYVGVWAQGDTSTSTAKAMVTGSTFSNAQYGVVARGLVSGSTTLVTLSASVVTGMSAYGVLNTVASGTSTFETLGNNVVRGNGTDFVGPMTSVTTN